MGKVIFWIVLIFGVLFALRLYNAAKGRRRADDARAQAPPKPPAAEAMVQCARCGVYLPRADAKPVTGGFQCGDQKCARLP